MDVPSAAIYSLLKGDTVQLPDQATSLSPDAFNAWRTFGEWLTLRYGDPRLTPTGNLAVPASLQSPPVFVGMTDSSFGPLAEFYSPFLVGVVPSVGLFEVLAMNFELTPFGSVRTSPENDDATLYTLEVRTQVPAALLTQEWVYLYVDQMARSSADLLVALQPAFGGLPAA